MAPRTQIEEVLAAIWAQLLHRERVGVHDNFFDLGGHSLLAVKLMVEVQSRLSLAADIPLATIFEHGTIERLASWIQHQSRVDSVLVPLQTTGSRPPVFCVHSVTGEAFSYRVLARKLGAEQPVYALQSVGINEGEAPLTSIEMMAEAYLQHVRRIQPNGPYRFVGHSMGGVIAYEMARQLRQCGEEVVQLALVDTSFSRARTAYLREDPEIALEVLKLAPPWLPEEVLSREEKMRRIHGAVRSTRSTTGPAAYLAQLDAAAGARYLRTVVVNHVAWRAYAPRPYAGRATLICAERGLAERADLLTVCANVDVRDVPGDHYSILEEPHVTELARQLARWS